MRVLTLMTSCQPGAMLVGINNSLHIDRSETAMGDRATDGAGQRESRVKSDARKLLGGVGFCPLNDGIKLLGAGGR